MLKKYIVTRDDGRETQVGSCISAVPLLDYHSIIAAGFDPYDPFAQFSVDTDDIPEEAFSYGLSSGEVIIDRSVLDEMYKDRFVTQKESVQKVS